MERSPNLAIAGSLCPPDISDQLYFLSEAAAFDCVFQRQVTLSQQICDQLQDNRLFRTELFSLSHVHLQRPRLVDS